MPRDVAAQVDGSVKTARRVPRRLGDELNFNLTNRVPRALLTHCMGWFSRIRNPVLSTVSIAIWRRFSDLDLSDARKQSFDSLHDCFTRELKEGARPFDADPNVVASPCDASVGACGRIEGMTLLQAKGSTYTLEDLLNDDGLACDFAGGCYVTLRLKADMYHRFHAPHDCRLRRVTYIAGDAFNVNPPALARVRRLFCRNERAVILADLAAGPHTLALVPVAAILVASIRLTFVDVRLHLRYRGPNPVVCDAALRKGDMMGWFEHGSTIIVLAPPGFVLAHGIEPGAAIRAGRALMRIA
jgi:phosphatidylserine decarboxylase